MRKLLFSVRVAVCLLVISVYGVAEYQSHAQNVTLTKESYLMPPKEIADVLLAPRHENTSLTNLCPDGRKFLITKSDGMPTVGRMGAPCVYLGEMAFDPVANRARQLWIRSDVGYDLFFFAEKRTVPVQVPAKARVSNPTWSPDGSKLGFYAHFEDATHIYIADTETGYSRRLTHTPVLATMVTSFQWTKDGRQIQTVLPPDDGARVAPKNGVATEPKVRVALDGRSPSRTYRYLLESPHDMKLLEHLITGQLAMIDVSDGKVTKVGFPSMVRSVSMSPDGKNFRVATMKKPFSYYVPAAQFGSTEGIWSLDGKTLYTLADRKLRETVPQPVDPTVVTANTTGTKGFGKKKGTGTQPTTPTTQPKDPDDPPQQPGFQTETDGKRELAWRPDGAGMSFIQSDNGKGGTPIKAVATDEQGRTRGDDKATDGKSAKVETSKDRVMLWVPPFGKGDVKVVYEGTGRISGVQYSDNGQIIFMNQQVENQRQLVAVDLREPSKTYVIYKGPTGITKDGVKKPDPANPTPKDTAHDLDDEQQKKGFGPFGSVTGLAGPALMTRSGRSQGNVVRISRAGEIYLSGTSRGEGKGSTRPYIDKVDIKTGKKTRIFESKSDLTETIDTVNEDDIKVVFTTRQAKDIVPDSYMTDLATNKTTKLTKNIDFAPWYHKLKTERFQVTRIDGFKFWVKVTLPPKHEGKLPAMFWIYPREYTDQAAYNTSAGRTGTVTGNRFTSPAPRSMALLTLLGYAVVEPDVPIVGPAGRMNDNYVPDLRNSLWAVIDALDKKGIIDRDRLAIGGHSYGAFSTANALAHTPFFKAGIAGDGNYNRTLTPMSFQTERRHLWDARETYLEMSPMLWANRMHGALLMYHGMDDANVGTNPINAEFLFMTLRGLGKPAALYMYPYEGHGPIALETNLDMWARWVAWLDTYVKNHGQPTNKGQAAATN